MPITYNSGLNRINVKYTVGDQKGNSLANPYDLFEDCYQADVAGGWGFITKDGNNYTLDGPDIYVTGSIKTYASASNSVLRIKSANNYVLYAITSVIKLYNCIIYSDTSVGYRIWIRNSESGAYNCVFKSIQYCEVSYAYNCMFQDIYYLHLDVTTNFQNCLFANVLTLWIRGAGTVNNIIYSSHDYNSYGIWVDNLYVSGNIEVEGIKTDNLTYDIYFRVAANDLIVSIINSNIDLKKRALVIHSTQTGGTCTAILKAKFNAYITNATGATLKIYNVFDELVYSEVLSSENMAEQKIEYDRQYLKNTGRVLSDDVRTISKPFTITVEKSGYNTLIIQDINYYNDTIYVSSSLTRECLQISAVEITDISAAGLSDGTLTVTAIGGDLTYEYSIDNVNWQASNEFTGLAAADYTVYVRSGDSQTADFEVTVDDAEETLPQITAVSISNVTTVSGSDGSITVTATGINTPLTYSIGGDFQSSNVFTGLPANTYTITVKDSRDNTDVVAGVKVSEPVIEYIPALPLKCYIKQHKITGRVKYYKIVGTVKQITLRAVKQ